MVSLSKWGNQDETLSSGRELLPQDRLDVEAVLFPESVRQGHLRPLRDPGERDDLAA
jgi:hypothetical protein